MAGLPEERPDGLDSPRAVTFIKYMSKAQVAVFKATNGRVGNKWRVGAGLEEAGADAAARARRAGSRARRS